MSRRMILYVAYSRERGSTRFTIRRMMKKLPYDGLAFWEFWLYGDKSYYFVIKESRYPPKYLFQFDFTL